MTERDITFIKYKLDKDREDDIVNNKDEYNKLFEERYTVLESNIDATLKLKDLAISLDREDITTFINSYGYLNIFAYDLTSVGYNLYFEKGRWQKIYFARQVALLIYEALEDIPVITGKVFKIHFQEVKGMTAVDKFIEEMRTLSKQLNKFKALHRDKLFNIRVNVAAHRDIDINKQLEIIGNINPYEIISLMLDFQKIVKSYIDKLQWLIVQLVSVGNSKG